MLMLAIDSISERCHNRPRSKEIIPDTSLWPNPMKGEFCVAIYTITQYKVRPEGVEKVKRAIQEFVPYVKEKEPGTRMYLAWQQQDDPTRFVHFFIFEDEAAHKAHSG